MLKKKLLIEFVIGMMIVFSFFTYQSLASRILTSPKSQIVFEGKEITYDHFTLNKTIKETTNENVFEITLDIEDMKDQPNNQVIIVLDTRSENLNQFKWDALLLLDTILSFDPNHAVKLFTLDQRQHELLRSSDYYGDGAYLLSLESIENRYTLNDIRGHVESYVKQNELDNAYVVVFSDERLEKMENDSIHLYNFYQEEDVTKTLISTIENKQWIIKEELSNLVEFLYFKEGTQSIYDESTHTILIPVNEYFRAVSYSVRLKNEAAPFVSRKDYSLARQSYLEYDLEKKEQSDFSDTIVTGYQTDVGFHNLNSISNAAIGNSVFSLTHDSNCIYCNSWRVDLKTFYASNNQEGYVIFEKVPSGHRYVLSQIEVDDNYELSKTTCNVSIVYGKVFYDGMQGPYIFENIPKHNNSLKIVLECEENNQIQDYPYELYYKITGSGQVPLPEKTVVVADENGKISFDPIHFSDTGVYNYKITCMNKGVEANEIIAIVNVTSELLSGNQDLNASVTYYNQAIKNNKTILITP